MNLRITLAKLKKNKSSTDKFLTKMQTIIDDLAAAGCPVSTREHISFILAGLGSEYNFLVAAFGVGNTTMTLSSLYSQLNAYDQRQELLHDQTGGDFETSANAAFRQQRSRG